MYIHIHTLIVCNSWIKSQSVTASLLCDWSDDLEFWSWSSWAGLAAWEMDPPATCGCQIVFPLICTSGRRWGVFWLISHWQHFFTDQVKFWVWLACQPTERSQGLGGRDWFVVSGPGERDLMPVRARMFVPKGVFAPTRGRGVCPQGVFEMFAH